MLLLWTLMLMLLMPMPLLAVMLCCAVFTVVMHRLMDAMLAKITATKEEREARRQFTIERSGEVPTMRTQASPAQQQQQAAEE